jgi:hypothetical protein
MDNSVMQSGVWKSLSNYNSVSSLGSRLSEVRTHELE